MKWVGYVFIGVYAFASSIFVYLNAHYLDGDFENYRQAYSGGYQINELGFNSLIYIFNSLNISYFTFFVCINIIVVLSIYNVYRYYKIPYWCIICTSTYIIYYLSSGHFRSIMPFILFAAGGRLRAYKIFLGTLLHYGYLLVFLYYSLVQIFRKFHKNWLIISVFVFLSIVQYFILETVYFNDVLSILGMDRFQKLYVTNELIDVYENRNILSFYNIKLDLLLVLLFLINWYIQDNKIKLIFSAYPLLYIIFSFDAYIAQKSILFVEPLAICAAGYIENFVAKYLYALIVLTIYSYSILMRWQLV